MVQISRAPKFWTGRITSVFVVWRWKIMKTWRERLLFSSDLLDWDLRFIRKRSLICINIYRLIFGSRRRGWSLFTYLTKWLWEQIGRYPYWRNIDKGKSQGEKRTIVFKNISWKKQRCLSVRQVWREKDGLFSWCLRQLHGNLADWIRTIPYICYSDSFWLGGFPFLWLSYGRWVRSLRRWVCHKILLKSASCTLLKKHQFCVECIEETDFPTTFIITRN